jgi:hypothetical protein
MQKSYVVKSTISFIDFNFYVRPGDLLVHDTANHNRLTVYRNGQIVKVIRVEPIGIAAFLKSKFIEEPPANAPTVLVAVVAVKEAPKATPVVTDAPVAKPDLSKEAVDKRRKAYPTTLTAEEFPDRLKEALKLEPVLEEIEK